MSKTRTITLYPNIHLEYDNHNCIVNYSYPRLNISSKNADKRIFNYYTPDPINSMEDLYALLNFLNKKSGRQSIYIATKKQIKFSIILLLFGLVVLIVPPSGVCIIILAILGLIGYFNLVPRILITSNLSEDKLKKVLLLVRYTYGKGRKKTTILENLIIDGGAKVLLFSYKLNPTYYSYYEHVTKSGAVDRRYKNNSLVHTKTGYELELSIPPKCYNNPSFYLNWYDDFIREVNDIDTEIKTIRLGMKIEPMEGSKEISF